MPYSSAADRNTGQWNKTLSASKLNMEAGIHGDLPRQFIKTDNMSKNDSLNFRIENIAPILYVKDMSRSLAFYVDILGFKNAEWGNDDFTSINRDNSGLYLCKGGQGLPGTWVWIGFDGDIFSLHQKFIAHSVTIKLPPTNFSYAYEMQITDPDGHVLRFGTDPNEKEPFVKW